MVTNTEDRKSIQSRATEMLNRTGDSSNRGSLTAVLKEQFPDAVSAYEMPGDLNTGLVVRIDGRIARAIVSQRPGRSAVRYVFEDGTARAIGCDSFQFIPPSNVKLFDYGKPVGEFDTEGALEVAFLCSLLQAAEVGRHHS